MQIILDIPPEIEEDLIGHEDQIKKYLESVLGFLFLSTGKVVMELTKQAWSQRKEHNG